MAVHELIDGQIRILARRLPPASVVELADGLAETYQAHRLRCGDPDVAARAALAEFGDADIVSAAFVSAAPGRRMARRLLAAGPLVGLAWGAALITGRFWEWPLPGASRLIGAILLVAAIVALFIAATQRYRYQSVRLGAAGGGSGMVLLDIALLTTATAHLSGPHWAMVTAMALSLARMVMFAQAVPDLLSRR
jgi:hypothetical protein